MNIKKEINCYPLSQNGYFSSSLLPFFPLRIIAANGDAISHRYQQSLDHFAPGIVRCNMRYDVLMPVLSIDDKCTVNGSGSA